MVFAVLSYLLFVISSIQLVRYPTACTCTHYTHIHVHVIIYNLKKKHVSTSSFILCLFFFQILCMISDSKDNIGLLQDMWKKAFRITIRKCILGTVMAATGTRAIYFTVQVPASVHLTCIFIINACVYM